LISNPREYLCGEDLFREEKKIKNSKKYKCGITPDTCAGSHSARRLLFTQSRVLANLKLVRIKRGVVINYA
jgi:hypothetical protein